MKKTEVILQQSCGNTKLKEETGVNYYIILQRLCNTQIKEETEVYYSIKAIVNMKIEGTVSKK